MKILNYLMILALLNFFSCSNSDNDLEDYDDDDIEMVDEDGDDLELEDDEEVEIVDAEDDDFEDGFEDGDEDDIADLDEEDEFEDSDEMEVADLDDEGFDDEFNEEFSDEDGEFQIADLDSDDSDLDLDDSDDLDLDDEGSDDIALDDGDDLDLSDDSDLDLSDDSPEVADTDMPAMDNNMSEEAIEGPGIASSDIEAEAVDTSSDFPAQTYDEPAVADSSYTPDYSSVNVPANAGGSYTVQRNETLMLISYKLYGDYSRWKEIAALNADKLKGGAIISEGMNLKYSEAGAGFSSQGNGVAYLIEQGDTLGKISNKVYGMSSKWKSIWENNRAMIKDPNKIYTGFTLYYQPDPGYSRDLSSTDAPVEEAQPAAAEEPAPVEELSMEEEDLSDDLSLEDDFPEDL